ncbi:MAG: ATP-binding cassette domain-containing protein [Rhodospirillales bacterium]|jgi:oligopeptide/dipeptide ABC transporter ATP-binding protein|nr:ATP-binding cassette domain-containing protein [Rhodospirillales bacterium]MDP6645468.1 ATP-binding cassette domain-containing protein [Rhodospirillales bacterium]MDP6841718.1 ATP-binding cassette domain-containing protein [Rhodospirillales bacterium]
MNTASPEPLVEVRNLVKYFPVRGPGLFGKRKPPIRALNGVSFELARGETLAIVGESGCGKSTLAKTLALLHRPDGGEILFNGKPLAPGSNRRLKDIRRRSQLIFQDPYGSLNPRLTAAEIIAEPLIIHNITQDNQAGRIENTAKSVGLRPEDLGKYPHQFSGGQRQRIAIARALVSDPELVIADEPLSALDVSVQSQVINLLVELKDKRGLTYIFISHDLSVVEFIADRVAVMYLGRIVELAPSESLFSSPLHPYTRALLEASPEIGARKRKKHVLSQGEVANPANLPDGCPFHPRCPKVQENCGVEGPKLELFGKLTDEHAVACHHIDLF